ncbi:MAG TPA: type 2 isopentenyl-diphosphate Delta-isomerase [Candidatus Deferrimicrobium sp.]|nr:type 2 isopentenyl-diphosphate Delta-isomerase [Candidatus Deferrimicrobium sp.]
MREIRKVEHIHCAINLPDGPLNPGFNDIRLVHNALPELSLAQVDTRVTVFDTRLELPVLVNAITGGNQQVLDINRALAKAAYLEGFGIAVGSQTGALIDSDLEETFSVVRRENPTGLVIANVGAGVDAKQALRAIKMVEANALQVHLNVPQELAMLEGDRDFRNLVDNVGDILEMSPVPVIVKEVGFGLSLEAARTLQRLGVSWVDVGGAGGTNFVAIEHKRGQESPVPVDWGIPTAISLAEVIYACPGLQVIASGGIRSPLDTVKALALGASLAGIAGMWLKSLMEKPFEDLIGELRSFKQNLKYLFLLLGAQNVAELSKTPLVIAGPTGEWLRERGVDTKSWAQKR